MANFAPSPAAETRAADAPARPRETVGDLLRRAREEHGISLAQAAAQLRIRQEYLTAIEQARYDDLPGPTYALGFVRAYANHLGLDGDEAVRRFKLEASGIERPRDLIVPAPLTPRGIPGKGIITTALILLVCAYGIWHYVSAERSRPGRVAAVPSDLLPSPPPMPAARPPAVVAAPPQPASATVPPPRASSAPSQTEAAAPPTNGAAANNPPQQTATGASPTAPATGAPAAAPVTTVTAMPLAPPAATLVAPAPPPMPGTSLAQSSLPPPAPSTTAPAQTALAPVAPTPPTPSAPPAVAQQAPAVRAVPGQGTAPPDNGTQTAATPQAPAAGTPGTAAAANQPAAAPPPTGPKVYGAIAGPSHITLKATQDCWIMVRDGNDAIVAERLLHAGDSYRVPDRPGLVLRTGNASGLSVAVDDKPVPALGGTVRDVALDPQKLLAGTAIVE